MPREWVAFWVLSLDLTFFQLIRTGPGMVVDQISSTFGLSGTQVSFLLTLFFYVYGLLQIPVGAIVDAYGIRRVLVIGMFLTAIGQALFAYAPAAWLLGVGRVLSATGIAGNFIAMIRGIGDLFPPNRFATVYGMGSAVHSLAALLGTVPLAVLVGSVGWRGGMGVIAGLSLAAAVATYALLQPDRVGSGIRLRELWPALGRVVRNRPTWLAWAIAMGTYSPYLAFTGIWGVPFFMAAFGMTRITAAVALLWVTASPILFTPLLGYISERVLRRRKLALVGLAFAGMLFWGFLALAGARLGPVWLPVVLIGIGATGSGIGLSIAVGKQVNDAQVGGTVAGVINTGPLFGAAVLQLAVGLLLDLFTGGRGGALMTTGHSGVLGAYRWTAGLSAGCFLVAFLASLILPETQRRTFPF